MVYDSTFLVEICILWKEFWIWQKDIALRENCQYSELFWSAFSRIRIEYGEIQSVCAKMPTRITPNTDTFYAVSETFFKPQN